MKTFDTESISCLPLGSVISVTGCGGKTTLIEYAAKLLSEKYRVGIASTVHIAYPPDESYKKIYIGSCKDEISEAGIYYFADEVKNANPVKLHGLSEALKAQAIKNTDILFIEADGSAGKPLKAWRSDEPVIVKETTMTIGVAAPDCIGLPANEVVIHRLGLYRQRYETVPEVVTPEMFRRMFEENPGMFSHARGEYFLWLNEIKLSAVILASGFSRRMAQNKLMMTIDGMPMIEHVIKAVADTKFFEKYVVTNQKEICEAAENYGMTAVTNSAAYRGQSASVVCGVAAAVEKKPDGLMFLMGDMPFIEPGMLRKLKTAFAASGGQKIIVPLYPSKDSTKYRRGNPVIFPVKYADELMVLTGDTGGRNIIKTHEDEVYEVHLSNSRWGQDMDTKNDIQKYSSLKE